MGPTRSGDDDRGSMFLPGMGLDRDHEVQTTVSADPNLPLRSEQFNLPDRRPGPMLVETSPSEAETEPTWARRIKLVVWVMLCIELGMLLVVLPWTPVWTQNSLLVGYPSVRQITSNDFLRGCVSGLGLVNIWMGIWEAVSYREKR